MKITRIELWNVAVPLPAPFFPSWIPGMAQRENRFDLVRLVTASGIEGWTAAPAMGRERSGFGSLLGPYFLGERADDLSGVRQRIREMGYLGLRLGWLEAACWDILGKARNKAVWRILGEHAARNGGPAVPVEAPRVSLYASTGEVRSPERRKQDVAERIADGFGGVKLRVHGPDLAGDIAVLKAAREASDTVELMVDANQGWRVAVVADAPRWDLERAIAFGKAAADLNFAWVEEPLAQDDYAGQVALRAALGGGVAIAGGELNNQGEPEFSVMLEKGCYDLYQPDAVFTGGISGTWRIIQRVIRAGARYSPHTWTNGIGFAMNLQLFAASPFRDQVRLEYPWEPPGWVPEGRDGILQQPWLAEKGTLQVPDAPGLGFAIDQKALSRHGKCVFVATPLRVAVTAVWDRGVAAAKELGAVREARLAARSEVLGATPDLVGEVLEPGPAPSPSGRGLG